MAYARAPDFALKIGPWLGAPIGWWPGVLSDILGGQCFVRNTWIRTLVECVCLDVFL